MVEGDGGYLRGCVSIQNQLRPSIKAIDTSIKAIDKAIDEAIDEAIDLRQSNRLRPSIKAID